MNENTEPNTCVSCGGEATGIYGVLGEEQEDIPCCLDCYKSGLLAEWLSANRGSPGASPSAGPARIHPTPDCGVGDRPLNPSQAANAIWNKLNVTMGLALDREPNRECLRELIGEARELADLIVHCPAADPADIMFDQFCRDLNQAHDELMKAQGAPEGEIPEMDWPEWSPQANSIRWAEERLGRKLAKTDLWTLFPDKNKEAYPE